MSAAHKHTYASVLCLCVNVKPCVSVRKCYKIEQKNKKIRCVLVFCPSAYHTQGQFCSVNCKVKYYNADWSLLTCGDICLVDVIEGSDHKER